jgi:hypothetical protein
MRSSYEAARAEQIEIQGRILSGRDTLVPPCNFARVCKLFWPEKTAAHLATITGHDERTAKRWLSGEYDPPMLVALAVINRIFQR